ncbi:glucose-1-phosphate cytidylyltransferase [Marinivivus vitaminiproducens]|uniref:glucose-1-phosphate cytidylyltransferase n=1 Tax=Marinivivus vitaminiproducens TaxID=3035935 RepID=UPI0027A4B97C|nr:glucose-1-phosphate cytidylyltransferase [Geminicoccaceae bacterium SCSIO 64248]
MKVVLFCGGLGMRLRELTEVIPKPMVPVGNQPILWHVMQYYSAHGHRDFILCLGYKATVIKDYFLNYRPTTYSNFVVSGFGERIEILDHAQDDWRVALIDTGVWRNIGERLLAVRRHVENEPMFLANYSDGVTDLPLSEMIDWFEKSGKIAAFIAVRPTFSYHLIDMDEAGAVQAFRISQQSDMWINGGYMILRREIFDYIKPGEELVVEPFERLIAEGQLAAYRYTGFWASLDTLKDKQRLEEMVERGETPWLPHFDSAPSESGS